MEYNFSEIEKKWQAYWKKNKTFKTFNPNEAGFRSSPSYKNGGKPFYVLDMFPYPSGAGLHVGHPLGYIASDIFSRYKRLKGFNVLHPMGYDSFGLPAEQYAIQTGQHPRITTETNIARYREQLDKLGFSFDWDREVRTSDPSYYKWTQWIFIQLFNSWYNPITDKAESILTLIDKFQNSTIGFQSEGAEKTFGQLTENEKSDILLNYRLAYLSDTMVNWCPQLGTVLANEEVKEGLSERGGYPVERKLMKQWSLRITAYANRLLNDLEGIDWTESIKEAQRNWIGKSEGTSLRFLINSSNPANGKNESVDSEKMFVEVFTTRPDTIFGVSFITLAPEHDLVGALTSIAQKDAVEEYVAFAKNRSERERMADVKNISGVFTGSYAIHPFTKNKVPVWIGDYVLAGYGTGVVMAVPAHDSRDFAFANYFGIEKKIIIQPPAQKNELLDLGKYSEWNFEEKSFDDKEGRLINSDFLDGLEVKAAIKKIISIIEERGLGKRRTNFRLRDSVFGRQRYWGEPIPVYYENGIPKVLPENELPLLLPEVDKYLPTETGEPPLARAKDWKKIISGQTPPLPYEHSTMPGWAGSSWYFLRYMDANNNSEFISKEAANYWQNIDLYIGGAEHATGHLLYLRFWTKFLNDLGLIPVTEPAKKLINQGMIQGVSAFVYRVEKNIFISKNRIDSNLSEEEKTLTGLKSNAANCTPVHVDVNIVKNNVLDIEAFKNWREEYKDAVFITEENGSYICGAEVEKMSKSKWNVVSPDLMVENYGADCLRLYEMFLGPLEQSKPWNTSGISGVSNFMRKLWRLYKPFVEINNGAIAIGKSIVVEQTEATKAELKTLHKTIKKIAQDIENFSFNTSVSSFMICVNELTELKCNKRDILEPLAILVSPYAPHIAEELWSILGHTESISYAAFPICDESFLIESSFNYPISFNGKTRFFHEYDRSLSVNDVEKQVLSLEQTHKYLEGKVPKKIIVVQNKIVNIVI